MKTPGEYKAAAEELERAVELTPDGMLCQARYLRNLADQASQVKEQEPVAWYYEWDTGSGLRRSFDSSPYNEMPPNRAFPLYPQASAPTEHTAAADQKSEAGNNSVLDAAVGVPDVANIIARLRYRQGFNVIGTLDAEAAEALAALQAQLADAKAMANHYENAFDRRGAQNAQQAELLRKSDKAVEQHLAMMVAQAATIKQGRELLVDCYGNAGVFSIDLAARLTEFLERTSK